MSNNTKIIIETISFSKKKQKTSLKQRTLKLTHVLETLLIKNLNSGTELKYKNTTFILTNKTYCIAKVTGILSQWWFLFSSQHLLSVQRKTYLFYERLCTYSNTVLSFKSVHNFFEHLAKVVQIVFALHGVREHIQEVHFDHVFNVRDDVFTRNL